MGEYADMMINGETCMSCGDYLGGGAGYERECRGCKARAPKAKQAPVTGACFGCGQMAKKGARFCGACKERTARVRGLLLDVARALGSTKASAAKHALLIKEAKEVAGG
jgi:predicted amidophosphoribosyltransferase